MKRLLMSAAMFLCCVATMFAQYSGSGNGTEDDPYLIYNENQLSQVSNFLNQEGVVFKLMKDLDLTSWIAENNPSQGWLPIGVKATPFKGTFKGNNHKIAGLMINRTSTEDVGFFGYISGATIENLTIIGTSVTGKNQVGGIIGFTVSSNIVNCNLSLTNGVEGIINVGGFVGQSLHTSFSNVDVKTYVKGQSYIGGFVGLAEGGTFQDGTLIGLRTSTGEYVGGFAGKLINTSLSDIKHNGDVSGLNYTGGLIGCCSNVNLTRCNVESNVHGAQYVSGFSGALENATSSFDTCFHKGKITATGDYCGGIVGISQGACIEKMENCNHFGDIEGGNLIGGLIGGISDMSLSAPQLNTYHVYERYGGPTDKRWYSCSYNYSDKIVSGNNTTITIKNCSAVCMIKGYDYLGGLVGSNSPNIAYTASSTTFTNNGYGYRYTINGAGNYWSGNGDFKYYTYYKGIKSISIESSYYNGIINGKRNVGGIVGSQKAGAIKYCYSNAIIYGEVSVGGIAGEIMGIEQVSSASEQAIKIKSCLSNNKIISAASSNIGRIYGNLLNSCIDIGALGSVEGNRALTQTKVILQGVVQEVEDDLQNGTSIGSSLLRLKATYVSMDWDFDNNWDILETECYPYKKYQAAPPVIESELVSQATSISGKSLKGGTVYLYYKDHDAVSTVCDGHQWSFDTEALQSGALVQIYADVEGMTPSYLTTTNVCYPGSGTENDPYRIYTAEDLQGASNRGYYKLMNDIDLTSWINENSPTEGWPAIGRNSGEATYIDGDGHKVTGLWMNTTQNYNGLFSNFSAGQIKNLTVKVATGKKVKGGDYTGILIGRNANGKIINCVVKGDAEGIGHVGGVVGYAENTTINFVTAEANITGTSNVGGIVGQISACTLTTCNAATTIVSSGAESKVGGLVGYAKGGSISTCTAENNLTAADETNYVGGLVGYSEAPISLSFSMGNVAATGSNSYSGGLVGYALSTIENCYSTANTAGTQYTAGLVGYTFSTIDKCYAKGNVCGVKYGGGVAGELDGVNASLTNSIAANNILSLSAQSSWGSRVIGGFKNGAEEPDNTNYALSTMQVSLNNVPQTKTDDPVEGIAKTAAELTTKATYQELGWDFTIIWNISDGTGYPYLTGATPVSPDDPNPGDDPEPVTEPDTDISSMNNVIYLNKVEANADSQINLSIRMKNNVGIRGFQFDLYLPEGITAVKNAKGKIINSLSEGRLPEDDEHSLSLNEQSDGSIRFLCGSLYDETFTGNDGEIATISVKLAEDMEDGDYPIILRNLKLTETYINNFYQTDYVKSTLTVKSYMLGDINGDGKVDVSDYIGIANHILGNTPEGFVLKAADVNEDGLIDVSDYIGVANIILSGSIYGSQQ